MMIVDDAEGILRFLDNVSVQLADLLDIEGQRTSKRSRLKDAANQQNVTRQRPTSKQSKTGPSSAGSGQRKRHQLLSKGNHEANRVRGRRKQQQQLTNNNDAKLETNHQVEASPISQAVSNCVQSTNTASPQILEHNIHRLDTHYTDSSVKSQSGNNESQLDTQLTLNLTDDLAGSSISPITQLSPIDQSIQQFSSPVIHHQQHYYTNRTHLDPYPTIQDEFSIGAHESNPIIDPATHLLGTDQVQRINYHEIGTISDQQPNPLQDVPNSDCYPLNNHITQPLNHHHHHHHHHNHHNHHNTHHHQHQHQEPHQHHVVQFSHLDQPAWLCSTSHNTSDNVNLQQSTVGQPAESDTLEHVVPFSPNAQQTLEQVQFTGSMYHPTTTYYTHSTTNDQHLDSFRHLTDDFGANRSTSSLNTNITSTNDSSSPLGQLHRLVTHDQQSHPPQTLHNEQQSHSVRSTLDPVNAVNDTTNMTTYHNHSHQDNYLQNQSHLNETTSHNLTGLDHLQQNRNYSSQQSVHLNTPTTTTTTSQNTQLHHTQHHHHHQHHHHNQHLNQSHHVLPLINGLEPSGVIIQDINLAAASWSSPEDLYGI